MFNFRMIAGTVVIAMATVASACNIPVFRYALERWKSDAYEVVIAHSAPLSQPQQAFVDALTAADGRTNVTVHLKHDATATTPMAAVGLPMASGRTVSHWQGTLDEAAKVNLVDSPARTELVKRLLAGHSVVWLLVRSDDQARSDAVRNQLGEAFQTLETRVQLPQGIGEPGSELHSEVPLLVKFSAIEIEADSAEETFLVQWLSGFRPAALAEGEPLLVPVFGRGRALEVIPAGEVSSELVEDLTLFLSGACSCQVKEQNPGFDLLLSADWDQKLFGADGLTPPPAKASGDRQTRPRTLTIPPGRQK